MLQNILFTTELLEYVGFILDDLPKSNRGLGLVFVAHF